MYKRVDEDEDVQGFSYENKNGNIEAVVLADYWVLLKTEDNEPVSDFYYEDIPSLIKALQAAYDYKKGQK